MYLAVLRRVPRWWFPCRRSAVRTREVLGLSKIFASTCRGLPTPHWAAERFFSPRRLPCWPSKQHRGGAAQQEGQKVTELDFSLLEYTCFWRPRLWFGLLPWSAFVISLWCLKCLLFCACNILESLFLSTNYRTNLSSGCPPVLDGSMFSFLFQGSESTSRKRKSSITVEGTPPQAIESTESKEVKLKPAVKSQTEQA